jgi:hypothetical protein
VLFHCYRKGPGLVAATEMRSLEPANRRRIYTVRTSVQRVVDNAVLDGAARGLFRAEHPLDASRAVVTMAISVMNWFKIELALTPEAFAERYVEYALNLVDYRESGIPSG